MKDYNQYMNEVLKDNLEHDLVYFSAFNDRKGVLKTLEKGADINMNNGQILNYACYNNNHIQNLNYVKFLIENGADIKYINNQTIINMVEYSRYETLFFIVEEIIKKYPMKLRELISIPKHVFKNFEKKYPHILAAYDMNLI